jgi:hypothetical protein
LTFSVNEIDRPCSPWAESLAHAAAAASKTAAAAAKTAAAKTAADSWSKSKSKSSSKRRLHSDQNAQAGLVPSKPRRRSRCSKRMITNSVGCT